jgi:type IV secretion system protein TrbL
MRVALSPGGIVSGAAGSVLGAGASAVFDAASHWVAEGAEWLLDQVGSFMSVTTSAGLGTSWFTTHESAMAVIAAGVILPMACVGAIQAVYHQNPGVLARSFLVNLPLALLFTGVAVELVRLGLAITDSLSQRMLAVSGGDTGHIFNSVSGFLANPVIGATGAPTFVVFIAALVVAVCAFTLWLELVVRAAAVSAATLFLPLALATLVWPAVSHWCRRLADTLVALVLSKFVIASVLSLAAGAIAGGIGDGGPDGGGVAAALTGVALLLIATLSPFTLLRLVPAIEAGAISHLESARHRLAGAAHAPVKARDFALDVAAMSGSGSSGGAAGAGGGTGLAGASGAGVGTTGAGGAAAAGTGGAAAVVTGVVAAGRTVASAGSRVGQAAAEAMGPDGSAPVLADGDPDASWVPPSAAQPPDPQSGGRSETTRGSK